MAGRTGTIATRMRGTAAQDRCRAKTGTLRDVSALAGYCTTDVGRARRLRLPHELRERLRRADPPGPHDRGAREVHRLELAPGTATPAHEQARAARPRRARRRRAAPPSPACSRPRRRRPRGSPSCPRRSRSTRPPAARIRSVACSRVRSGSVPVSTSVRPASGPSPGGGPSASSRTCGRRSSISARSCSVGELLVDQPGDDRADPGRLRRSARRVAASSASVVPELLGEAAARDVPDALDADRRRARCRTAARATRRSPRGGCAAITGPMPGTSCSRSGVSA